MDSTENKTLKTTSNSFLQAQEVKQYTYKLNGLNCANCADKIERKLNERTEITFARIDFPKQKLIIEFKEKDFKIVEDIVHSIEDNVKIVAETDNIKLVTKESINYKILISISLSLLIILFTFLIPISDNLKIGMYLIAYLIASYDILIKVVKNLIKGQIFDENFLMGIAGFAAFGIGEYLEAIAIIIFYKVGEFCQDLAVKHSRRSITNLMDLKAEYANIVEAGQIKQVDPSIVKVGDQLIIKPGEKVPVDGKVIAGSSYLDTKALTGESLAQKVRINDEILSGSINQDSPLTIEVTKEYQDSTVAKILDLVENSSINKAPTENFITKFARIYTPIVVLVAILVALIPSLTFSNEGFYPWLYRSLIFLVVSCPCALVISIPLGFFGGIGCASKHGILIKGANYLEALNKVETIVFDKTGTLTKGNFALVNIKLTSKCQKDELLKYAAYAESYSNHPIAIAIKEAYHEQVALEQLDNYQEISGQGIQVEINNEKILAGNSLLMENNGIKYEKQENDLTIIYLAKEKDYLGYLELADQVKNDSVQGLKELKALGIKKLIMLTGDKKTVAQKVAKTVGIDQFFASLLPQQKVERLKEIINNKTAGHNVVFVGDGINDAPVLAQADLGIAMGGVGSDAAIETADIVIMNDEIPKIATAIKIARKTKRIVNQNIILALGIKAIVLILGVLGMAMIWEAVVADVGVTILAIFNSIRILNNKNI